MIPELVERFDKKRDELKARFSEKHPGSYENIVKILIETISDSDEYGDPDPKRITTIDHGDYQGSQLFVIASNNYQPDTYWYTHTYYGSCSGCDTLEGIRCYDDDPPKEEQVKEYMTLALHLLQKMKKIETNGT